MKPFAFTSQVPPSSAETTSSRPGAGNENSAGSACSIPTASRTDLKTALPGGERAATTTAATARAVAASASLVRGCRGAGVRSSKARFTTSHALSSGVTFHPIETAAEPRVDGAARQVEQLGDLPRRVLEEVAEHDHCAVLGRELADAGERGAVGLRRRRSGHVVAELDLRAQAARARPVDRTVDDDPVQPRAERAAPVEAVEVADSGQERFLR